MAYAEEPKSPTSITSSASDAPGEKKQWTVETREFARGEEDQDGEAAEYGVSGSELQEMKALADTFSLEVVQIKIVQVLKIHENDPNFPQRTIEKLKCFMTNKGIVEKPEDHEAFIHSVKLEIALITQNSPYAEVRAVVDNVDDPTTLCSTIRAWLIGMTFSVLLGFVNQLFSIRQPAIAIGGHVAQLLALPAGRLAAAYLPDWGFTLWGTRHSLNPGKFTKKEHMLITIMASVGGSTPFTTLIIWTQFLPSMFNMEYAGGFLYQIMIGLGTNFIGYGLAGLCRTFLVYPAYCVWPQSLVTIALNTAFHDEIEKPVRAPSLFRRGVRWMKMSRLKFFFVTFGAMFVYFWIPNYLFQAVSIFSWMSWIAPNDVVLNSIVGFNNGVGLNPIPTFDWNNVLHGGADPLMLPIFATLNKFAGSFVSLFVILALWYTNAFQTAYLPLNTNRLYDNRGRPYNVTRAIDSVGIFSPSKYEKYSPPFLTAGNINIYVFYFALYTAVFTYALLYHHHEMKLGFLELYNSFFKRQKKDASRYEDVHNRLMSAYSDVPSWWFGLVLVFAISFGVAGIAFYPTFTSPIVVFYGILMCLVFVVPIGVVKAMTGVEVNLAILAEFIGGSLMPGNALAMNFMKAYGFVTCAHAISFAHDLKLAHYVKIPPKTTFMVQMVATLISTFVCTALLNYQMRYIPNVCTTDAPFRFTCPHVTGFMSSSVLWGTIGPRKIFGSGAPYSMLLMGFPFGMVLTLAFWFVRRRPAMLARAGWLRQVHPVVILSGAIHWAPYNIGYIWPAVPIAWLSWVYIKPRYLEFWSKYNFVLSGSLSTGIAVAGLVIFFTVQIGGVQINWWGNNVIYEGCEAQSSPCRLKTLGPGEYFGPRKGEFS